MDTEWGQVQMALVVTAVHLGYDIDCDMILFYQCLEFFSVHRVSAASVLLHFLMLQESVLHT